MKISACIINEIESSVSKGNLLSSKPDKSSSDARRRLWDNETIETYFIKNCIEPTDDKLGCTLQSSILFHSEMQKGGGKKVTTFMGKTPQLLNFACRPS